jgi:hypothetical protein
MGVGDYRARAHRTDASGGRSFVSRLCWIQFEQGNDIRYQETFTSNKSPMQPNKEK